VSVPVPDLVFCFNTQSKGQNHISSCVSPIASNGFMCVCACVYACLPCYSKAQRCVANAHKFVHMDCDKHIHTLTFIRFLLQALWLSHSNAIRFSDPDCTETRSWQKIGREYQSRPTSFASGPLAAYKSESFKFWACFKGHPCLRRVLEFPHTNAMCYVYHEQEHAWYPWALQSEISYELDQCPQV
jgi:hypothetical protein